jgi:hypothetical protein
MQVALLQDVFEFAYVPILTVPLTPLTPAKIPNRDHPGLHF